MRVQDMTVTRIVLAWLFFVLPSMAEAQINGNALLERCITATMKARSLQANLSITGVGRFQNTKITGFLQLERPNRGRIEITTTESPDPIRRYCDGKLLSYFVDKEHYGLEEASDDGDNLIRDCRCNEALYFFKPEELRVLRATGTGMLEEGQESINGVRCRVLRLVAGPTGITLRLYIGPGDLLYGTDSITERAGAVFGFRSRLSKVKINPRFQSDAFRFKAQAGEVAYVSGPPGPALRSLRRLGKMPEVGATLTDFTLNDLAGKPIALSEVLHSNKVTILNFWAIYCAPCRQELPEFNARLADWKARGIGVLTVNLYDKADEVQAVWKAEGLHLPVVLKGDGTAGLYGVFGLPTTFVVDANGKLLDTIVGVDLKELQNTLDRAVGK